MSNSFARVAPRHSQSIHANAVDLWSELPRREGSPLIDLPRLGAFLARRWLLILLTTITVTGAFLLLAHFMFNKYTASALIMVDPRSTRVTQGQEVLSNFGSDAFAIESVVQIAKSESFLGKIVDRLGLGEDSEFGGGQSPRASAVDRLGGRLAIARRGATYVIDVAATSTDAQKSMRIANNAAQLIVEEQSRTRSDSTENAVTWLSTRINELQEKLRRSENAAASLKAKLKLTDAGQGFTLQERRIAELSRQSVVESARTAEARARLDQLRSSAAGVDQLPSSIQSPLLTTLRQELARLGRTLSDQATLLGERHPELVSMRAQIAGIRQQIKAEIANLRTAATTDLKEAQNREAAIAKQLREAQAQSGEQGQEAVGLAELEREAKADRAVYEQ